MTYFLRPKILLCWVCWLVAQDIAAQHQFFYGDVFDERNGLDATPRCMVQDAEGFYWIGTDEGLYRFDGSMARKIPFAFGDSLERRANHIYNLDFDRQRQAIWASTQTGIVRYDLRQGRATLLHPKHFFNKEDYQTHNSGVVFRDNQGEIWANFAVKGIVHLSDDEQKATAFPCEPAPSKVANPPSYGNVNIPRCFAQDPFQDSILWVGTRAGLLRFNKSTKQVRHYYYEHPDPFVVVRANPTTCIVAHQDGKIYLGSFNCGLVVFDPRTAHFTHHLLQPTASLEKVRLNYVRAIAPISASKILVSGTDEVFLFDTQTLQMTRIEGQHHFDYRDRSGNYWTFGDGKLILFHHLKNQIPRLPFPDSSYSTRGVLRMHLDTADQRLYLRVSSIKKVPLYSFREKKWSFNTLPLKDDEVIKGHVLEKTAKGMLVNNGHLFYNLPYGSARPSPLPIRLSEATGWLYSQPSPDGSVYISNLRGFLYQYFPHSGVLKTWTPNPKEVPSLDFFTNTSVQAVDTKGRAWICCGGGIAIFDPSTSAFSFYGRFLEGGHIPPQIVAMSLDTKGRMWVMGYDEVGWVYWDKPELGCRQYWDKQKGFGGVSGNFVLDNKDRLWFFMNKKLTVFDPSTESVRRFEVSDSEHLTRLSNGLLAFGHIKGIGIIHPDSLVANTEQPHPYVAYMKVFEKERPLAGSLFAQPDLYLSPDENFVTFGFSALGTLNPSKYRFAYQLEGVDKDWVYPEQGNRIAGYTALQGGHYTFRLKVSNNLGEWSPNVYEWRVHVATPWWATWQFRVLLGLSILGFVYFLVKNRFRQQAILLENERLILEQERSLRAERDRIAAEMHDDLGAGLSTIRMLSLTAKRRETDPDQANRIDKIARSAAEVMERMADIIWMMNSQNDTLENFTAYLRRYAAEYLDTHGIALQFDLPETIPPIPLSSLQRRNLLLVVKECLHNAVKYSQATQIHINIKINYKLIVCIQDNGVGFLEKPSDLGNTGGNGLKNIRARMAQIGGTANFSTQSGTAITIEL